MSRTFKRRRTYDIIMKIRYNSSPAAKLNLEPLDSDYKLRARDLEFKLLPLKPKAWS